MLRSNVIRSRFSLLAVIVCFVFAAGLLALHSSASGDTPSTSANLNDISRNYDFKLDIFRPDAGIW